MSGAPPLLGRELPAFVCDLLGSPPKVGEGLNDWLFRTARLLHPYRVEADIVAAMHAATHGLRVRAGEIERAVGNSKAAAWQPGQPPSGGSPVSVWPSLDKARRDKIVAGGPDAAGLCDLSPVILDVDEESHAPEIVETLFSTPAVPDPLVCVGLSNSTFATHPLSTWIHEGKLAENQFIVPSPMSKLVGTTKEGKPSEHCLDNTGPRRFLIVEFDTGTTDEHAALLWYLAGFAPLVLGVHSGNKSLQGWFFCAGQSETDLRRYMEYAVSLGADDATWTRSQFIRLPDGRRENGARQPVFYFDPSKINRRRGEHGE